MSEASYEHYENPREDNEQESPQIRNHEYQVPAETESEPEAANSSNPEPVTGTETLTSEIENFSRLSSELTELMSSLSQKIMGSADQLRAIQSAVDLKKEELKRLHDIDAAATALEQLIENHRLQKEGFESDMERQRRLWEEEIAQREQEERDYHENLRIQRQHEEEEYRRNWAVEQSKAREQLEEELRTMEQKNREKLEAIERDCLARELVLKEKELEWIQLIQELEQFISKLSKRIQAKAAARADVPKEDLSTPTATPEGELPPTN